MAFDHSALPADARLHYLRIGSQFGTPDVLAQRKLMAQALANHATDIASTGFGPDDIAEFEDLAAQHDAATGGRGGVVVSKRTGTKEVRAAFAQGRTARQTARAVLEDIESRLRRTADPAIQKSRETLTTILDAHRRAGGNPRRLLDQLIALKGAFDDKHVTEEGQTRGAPTAVADLTKAIADLEATTAAHDPSPGTPLQTELVDILEGALVEKFRLGFKAATAASAKLGSPALAHAFRLDALYPSSSTSGAGAVTPPA